MIDDDPDGEFGPSVAEILRHGECVAILLDTMARIAAEAGDAELAADLTARSVHQRALAAQVREACL